MKLTADSLIRFLVDTVGVDPTGVHEGTVLFSSGLVDSFSMLELITFIEEEAALRFDATDVSLENLDSIGQILRFVAGKVDA